MLLELNKKIQDHSDKAFAYLEEYAHLAALDGTAKTQAVLRRMDDCLRLSRKEFNIIITEVSANYIRSVQNG